MRVNIESRLRKLENSPKHEYSDVLELIRQGAFYDELTEEQKDRYCSYMNVKDRRAFEEVQTCIFELYEEEVENPLHFQLTYKEKPLTKEEFEERVKWVEEQLYKDDDIEL